MSIPISVEGYSGWDADRTVALLSDGYRRTTPICPGDRVSHTVSIVDIRHLRVTYREGMMYIEATGDVRTNLNTWKKRVYFSFLSKDV